MRISFWIAILSSLLGLAALVTLGWYEAGGDFESLPPFGMWCAIFAAGVTVVGIIWLVVQRLYREPDA